MAREGGKEEERVDLRFCMYKASTGCAVLVPTYCTTDVLVVSTYRTT